MQTKNPIRDAIITAFELSKRTKIPILLLANPGWGKTTTIYNIAKKYDMHAEVLMASQYPREEILGIQANEPGHDSLVSKIPEWYKHIMDSANNGKKTILFIDELSTVQDDTQMALLQLCFDRTIRGDRKLPDDCVVIAAGNYKANLPGPCDIIAPQLNRFCIINLLPRNAIEAIREFTQDAKGGTLENWPEFENIEISPSLKMQAANETSSMFVDLFTEYNEKSPKGFLDIRNTQYDGIFDRDDGIPEVFNFISGRTMDFLSQCLLGLASMGVSSSNIFFNKMIDGLIGLGTNTWTKEVDNGSEEATSRLNAYLCDIHKRVSEIYGIITDQLDFFKKDNTLSTNDVTMNAITEFIGIPSHSKYLETTWTRLFKDIYTKYSITDMEKRLKIAFSSSDNMREFRADMANLELLSVDINEHRAFVVGLNAYRLELERIIGQYKFYYNATNMVTTEDFDYTDVIGVGK